MEYNDQSEELALAVPTLNEAGNIASLLNTVQRVLALSRTSYTVTVVDDGSTDGTQEIVGGCSARDRRIRLLRREGEKGLAGAVLHGWSHSRAELLGVMDADLQHPPELLPLLVDAATDGADIAIASRYAAEDGVRGWNPVRVLLSRLSTLASRPFLRKLPTTDPMSGFFVVHRECIEGISFQAKGFKLLLEILVRGRIRKVREIPYQFGVRRAGRSKADPAVAFQYLRLLGRLSLDAVLKSGSQ